MGTKDKKTLNDELLVKPPSADAQTVAPAPLARPTTPDVAVQAPPAVPVEPTHVVEGRHAEARRVNRTKHLNAAIRRVLIVAGACLALYWGVRLYLYVYSSEIARSLKNFNEWFVR